MTQKLTTTDIQASAPGAFHEVLRWKLSDHPAAAVMSQVLAIPLGFLAAFALLVTAQALGKFEWTLIGKSTLSIAETGIRLAALVVASAVTIVLHELVHGLIMSICGAHPKYGALPQKLLFYATAPGYEFRRNEFLLVSLSPLLILSVLTFLGVIVLQGSAWIALLAWCAALNAGGSAGDLWMSRTVLRYPMTAHVVDERDGIRVLLPQE